MTIKERLVSEAMDKYYYGYPQGVIISKEGLKTLILHTIEQTIKEGCLAIAKVPSVSLPDSYSESEDIISRTDTITIINSIFKE